MNDFIWILVGLTSFFVFIYGDIKAHKEGRYDPKIFRVAQGYERKIKYKISILGILFPVHFISDSTIADFYFLTLSLSLLISKAVFLYHYYRLNKDKRLLFEYFIMLLVYVILFYMLMIFRQ